MTALVLVGHGSARHPEAARPIQDLAAALAARGQWSEVRAVFMKQAPGMEGVLDTISDPDVVVVPVFAGKGYYTDTLIPKALGLAGPLTETGGRRIRLTAPAGGHPRIPALMAERAALLGRAHGFEPATCGLLLIAHGSGRPGGAGDTPKAIAAAIAGMGLFAETALAFLEQEPFAQAWPSLIGTERVVALPLLVAQGMHASQDIPPLFGLVSGQTGPVDIQGRNVVLASGLGAEPELAEIVADLARDAG